MSSTLATVNTTFQPVANAKVPKEGPKAIPLVLDFTATQSYQVDLTQQQQAAKISFIQGAFIDNSANPQPLVIATGNSQQNLVIPGYSQAYVPLLLPNPPTFVASTTGGVVVSIIALNIPMDIAVWSVKASAFSFNGNGALQVSDTLLEALISGGALATKDVVLDAFANSTGIPVAVLSGGGGGNNFLNVGGGVSSSGNLVAGIGGKRLLVNQVKLWLSPDITAASHMTIQLYENGGTGYLFEGDIFPPTAVPATPSPVPYLLCSFDAMDWLFQNTGTPLFINIGAALTNGIIRYSVGYTSQ